MHYHLSQEWGSPLTHMCVIGHVPGHSGPIFNTHIGPSVQKCVLVSTFLIQFYKQDSSGWEIFENSAERLVEPPEGPVQFTILSFRVQLRRKLMFSTYILTLPAIFLSFLTLLEFWLPPDHDQKSALGMF